MHPTVEREEVRRLREELRESADQGDAPRLIVCLRALLETSSRPADYAFAVARLRSINMERAKAAGLKTFRTYIARSVTIETMQPYLLVQAAMAGLWLDVSIGGYGSFIDDLTNPDGALCRFQPDLVLFISDLGDLASGAQSAAAETGTSTRFVTGLLESFRANCKARIVVQGMTIPDPPAGGDIADANLPYRESRSVEDLNHALAEVCRRIGDAVYFDIDRLAARYGRSRWRDRRMFYSSRLAVASEFFEVYTRGLIRAIRALYFPPRKVLCTDLDDTLWGGILGEDGIEGVQTGPAFPGNGYLEYQKYLKSLAGRGVLVTVASKNNPADVQEIFQKRAPDLGISLDDFAWLKIGWGEKSTALRELAGSLSLGLDSMVFVDDSPVECASIRQQLPEVLVIEAPKGEPWRSVEMLESSGAFDTLQITEEDRGRVAEYRAQAERAKLESTAGSRRDFLASLKIQCSIISALDAPLSRTAQLLGKTNQFNLTTRRHSAAEIELIACQPGNIAVALRYRDRFGDGGVVGVALCVMEPDRLRIDTFLLSCRVIGRGVETALLWYIADLARSLCVPVLRGEFIPTAKNAPCADFYPLHEFERVETPDQAGGGEFYEMDLSRGLPTKPDWIVLSSPTS
jgi:FkbH-like protein